jgi:hypothetical protein
VPGVEGQEAIPGQDEIPAQPAVMAPKIERGFGGYGQPQETGQYEVSPAVAGQAAVAGQPAIAAKAGVPAGYISPETLKGIDIPEVKQLAMARYLAQFEPERVTLGENQRLLERTGGGGFKELVGPVTAADKSKIGNVNPSDYTPESLAKFSTSQNYGDLVLKPSKTDKPEKLIANINADSYTPESVAKFALSSNYGDLVLKPSKAEQPQKLIGNVNPSDYTPESIAKFALSSNYNDLVLKPAKTDKADRTIANVNPDSYTPASVAAFALSNNYADLVLKPEKAKDSKNIGNVNPNDFTPASIQKFVASGNYSDLVPVKKAFEGGVGGDKVPTGSISVLDPTDPTGKKVILVTQARAIKEGLTPASSTKEGGATEGERKAATLLQRLQFSQSQLTDALVADPNAAKPGLFASAVAKLSTPLANTLTLEARQRVQAAQLDILDAALTLGTGAAYTREQLEGYREAYFPQIGDKPNQIKDKQARLDNVISAAKIAAGRAAQLVPAAPAPAAAGGNSAISAADAILNKGRR